MEQEDTGQRGGNQSLSEKQKYPAGEHNPGNFLPGTGSGRMSKDTCLPAAGAEKPQSLSAINLSDCI